MPPSSPSATTAAWCSRARSRFRQRWTSIAAPSADEVVYWLSGPATLVPGDALITTDGRLTLCPDSWLQGASQADLARELHRLLELPVERVLTSHGAPLLAGGREALAAALDQTPA